MWTVASTCVVATLVGTALGDNIERNVSQKRHLRSSVSLPAIPQRVWFSGGSEISEGNNDTGDHQNNVEHIIQRYSESWNDYHTPINFLDEVDCVREIDQADPALLPYFQQEGDENNRADICRAAVLYSHGGYYFDASVSVVEVFVPKEHVTFAISVDKDGRLLFVASEAENPRWKEIMEEMLRSYERGLGNTPLGPNTWKRVFADVPKEGTGEVSLAQVDFSNYHEQPEFMGKCYFYSEETGRSWCDQLFSPNSAASGAYVNSETEGEGGRPFPHFSLKYNSHTLYI